MGHTERDLLQLSHNADSLHGQDIVLDPQFQGLNYLHWFLKSGSGFERLQPFQLEISSRTPKAGRLSPTYQFYLGALNKRNSYLTFAVPSELAEGVGALNVYPSILEKGEKPYYWLDFYSDNPQKKDRKGKSLIACRLMPENQINKIDFQHWHNIGEQLLADYLFGRNGITLEDLVPFDIAVPNKGALGVYRLAGERGLELHLGENQHINDGDTLRFTSHEDDQQLYQWMDVSKIVGEAKKDVASYRLLPNEKRVSALGWFGSERQLLIDHILDKDQVRFQNLRKIPAKVPKSADTINLIKSRLTGVDIVFNLPEGALEGGEDVVVVPCQDEQGFYEWLELYKANPESLTPEGECVASGRLLGRKMIQRGWRGPGIQLLKDYLSGSVKYENLRPISLDLGISSIITLWREGDEIVYLAPSKLFRLSSGDKLVLIPEPSSESGVDFIVTKDNQTLCKVNFDTDNRLFTLKEIFTDAGNNEQTGRYKRYKKSKEKLTLSDSNAADEMMRSLLEE